MKTRIKFPLAKVPDDLDMVLFLIKEELKSRRLFRALHQIGLDDCWFQPHLDSLIMRAIDLDHSDETNTAYNDILEKRCKKIDADHDSTMKQVMKAYIELLALRRKIQTLGETA